MRQNASKDSFASNRFAVFALSIILVYTLISIAVTRADDWDRVPSSSASQPATDAPSGPAAAPDSAASSGSVKVCGEQAVPASPHIKQIVSLIDNLWGVNFPVYQTVAPEQPHAATGGCVFYNQQALDAILTHHMLVKDPAVVDPLEWGIFAHEIGHQYHHDTDQSDQARADTPSMTKELEADRFAGYTLEKLQIPSVDLTPFWDMVGDDFAGGPVPAQYQHGLSSQRVAAFKQGWHLAEWNRDEDSGSVAEAEEESTAPETSAEEPK